MLTKTPSPSDVTFRLHEVFTLIDHKSAFTKQLCVFAPPAVFKTSVILRYCVYVHVTEW